MICAAGCGKNADPASSSSAAPSASTPPVASAGAGPESAVLAAPVKAVIDTCSSKWRPGNGFEASCPAFLAFSTLKIAAGSEDAYLVQLLGDPSEKVRSLGARGLAMWGGAFAVDKALAERIIAAAGKETSEAFVGLLGNVAGHIDAAATGLGESTKALVLSDGALQELQAGVISSFLPSNLASPLAFDLTRDMAKRGPNTRVRNVAVTALSAIYEKRAEDVCAIWMDALKAPEEAPAANAASRLTTGASWIGYSQNGWSTTSSFFIRENHCAKLQGAALTTIEARAKSDRLVDDAWVTALAGVFRDDIKSAPAADKTHALAIARGLVEKKEHSPTLRGAALRFLGKKDPQGPAYAAKFEKDPDLFLKTVAAEVAKTK